MIVYAVKIVTWTRPVPVPSKQKHWQRSAAAI
jgi:hypothetical protein